MIGDFPMPKQDKPLSALKYGARNSAADKGRIQNAHDLMCDLGADCRAMDDAKSLKSLGEQFDILRALAAAINAGSIKATYPWDQCIKDQTERYGDEETAKTVCGTIRAKFSKSAEAKSDGEDTSDIVFDGDIDLAAEIEAAEKELGIERKP